MQHLCIYHSSPVDAAGTEMGTHTCSWHLKAGEPKPRPPGGFLCHHEGPSPQG